MAAEMPYLSPPLALTVTGGDGDGDRTGYWTVTGSQDPHEVCATITRATSPDDGHLFFAWDLTQRTHPEHNRVRSYMDTIQQGFRPTFDEALAELTEAWVQTLGTT
jgi:hypothetical protein